MIIIIEKDFKNTCINICPKNGVVRVGSHYCLTMCKYFNGKTTVNGREAIDCKYEVKDVK